MKVCNHAPKWLFALENKMYEKIGSLNCEVWKTAEPVTFENKNMVLGVGEIWVKKLLTVAGFI